jgi:hypothetical protein
LPKTTILKSKKNEKEFEDCCQIAGGMAGNIPPNIKQILSLGYKNGGILSSPKTVKKHKKYSSIPNF